jgi:hypothetical protein
MQKSMISLLVGLALIALAALIIPPLVSGSAPQAAAVLTDVPPTVPPGVVPTMPTYTWSVTPPVHLLTPPTLQLYVDTSLLTPPLPTNAPITVLPTSVEAETAVFRRQTVEARRLTPIATEVAPSTEIPYASPTGPTVTPSGPLFSNEPRDINKIFENAPDKLGPFKVQLRQYVSSTLVGAGFKDSKGVLYSIYFSFGPYHKVLEAFQPAMWTLRGGLTPDIGDGAIVNVKMTWRPVAAMRFRNVFVYIKRSIGSPKESDVISDVTNEQLVAVLEDIERFLREAGDNNGK